ELRASGRVVKRGKSIIVSAMDIADQDDAPVGVAHASFMASPDPVSMPSDSQWPGDEGRLSEPLAERAGCVRVDRGTARLPFPSAATTLAGTLSGALLALLAEEAALSAADAPGLSHLAVRYLRAVREGPALARATVLGAVATIQIEDEGADGRLCAV